MYNYIHAYTHTHMCKQRLMSNIWLTCPSLTLSLQNGTVTSIADLINSAPGTIIMQAGDTGEMVAIDPTGSETIDS